MKTIYKSVILITLAWVSLTAAADDETNADLFYTGSISSSNATGTVEYCIPTNFSDWPIVISAGTNRTVELTGNCTPQPCCIPIPFSIPPNSSLPYFTTNCFTNWAWPPSLSITNLQAGDNGSFEVQLLPYPAQAPTLFIGAPPGPQVITLSNGLLNYTWEIVYSNETGLTKSAAGWTVLKTVTITNPTVNYHITNLDPWISNRFYRADWVTCP